LRRGASPKGKILSNLAPARRPSFFEEVKIIVFTMNWQSLLSPIWVITVASPLFQKLEMIVR